MEQFNVDLNKIDQSLLQNQDELDEFRKQLNLPIPERKSPQEVIMDLVTELEVKDDLINKLEGLSSTIFPTETAKFTIILIAKSYQQSSFSCSIFLDMHNARLLATSKHV